MSSEDTVSAASVRPALAEERIVFGLGLVGGSVARAARRAFESARITGVDGERPRDLLARGHACKERLGP